MVWINNVDSARRMDELKSSNYWLGRLLPDIECTWFKNFEGSREIHGLGFEEVTLFERVIGTAGHSLLEKEQGFHYQGHFKISGTGARLGHQIGPKVSRGDWCSIKHHFDNKEKKNIPFSVRNEKTLERRRKGDIKGKGPEGTRIKSNEPVCVYFQKGKCPKESMCDSWQPHQQISK